MNRKIVIIVSVLLALVFTFAITRSVNVRYAELRKTVEVAKVTRFIPEGMEIRQDQIESFQVPEVIGKDLIKPSDAIGKAARVSMVEGQYVYPGSVESIAKKPGMVEIHVPVDLPSSASVIAGDTVDVYAVDKGQNSAKAVELYHGAKVLHVLDQNGSEVGPAENRGLSQVAGPPGSRVPASAGLEVNREASAAIAQAGSQKRIYLIKSGRGE